MKTLIWILASAAGWLIASWLLANTAMYSGVSAEALIGCGIALLIVSGLIWLWYAANRAPTVRYYCGGCDCVYGYYTDGEVFYMAADPRDKWAIFPLVCPRCEARLHEEILQTPKENGTSGSRTHPNLTRPDAATGGILPEVDRIF